MQRDANTPKQYLASLTRDEREMVERIRKFIRIAAPQIRESMRYGMLDYPGLANLATQKQYVALYVPPKILTKHEKNFPRINAGKSCLRFSKIGQIDQNALRALLEEVLAYRRDEDASA